MIVLVLTGVIVTGLGVIAGSGWAIGLGVIALVTGAIAVSQQKRA